MDLSIVIPIRNQSMSLDLTLYWFDRILDAKSEIVLVDDGSDEDIKAVADRYPHLNLKYIRQEHGGRAAARNAGIRHAEGKRILFNDGDRFPAGSDLTQHRQSDGVMTGMHREFYFMHPEKKIDGLKNNFDRLKKMARAIPFPQLVRDHLFDAEGACVSNMGWMGFLTGNVSAPRDALLEAGGFDNGFVSWGVEHFELGYRMWKLNIPFYQSDAAVNYHIAHSREAGFYRGHMQESTAYFYEKYRDPHLKLFADFLFGNLSLQALEEQAPKTRFAAAPWLEHAAEPVFFKGLQSNILAAPGEKQHD